jgi:hypothetical protein
LGKKPFVQTGGLDGRRVLAGLLVTSEKYPPKYGFPRVTWKIGEKYKNLQTSSVAKLENYQKFIRKSLGRFRCLEHTLTSELSGKRL